MELLDHTNNCKCGDITLYSGRKGTRNAGALRNSSGTVTAAATGVLWSGLLLRRLRSEDEGLRPIQAGKSIRLLSPTNHHNKKIFCLSWGLRSGPGHWTWKHFGQELSLGNK
ncbi:uncharacterized protein RHO17_003627 isoform 1-T1 [Thomomys bottae]